MNNVLRLSLILTLGAALGFGDDDPFAGDDLAERARDLVAPRDHALIWGRHFHRTIAPQASFRDGPSDRTRNP